VQLTARRHPRPDRRPDLRPHPPPGHHQADRADRAGRQVSPRNRKSTDHPVQAPRQTRTEEGPQPLPHPPPPTRTTRQRPPQNIENPHQTPLPPPPPRPPRPSHPHPPTPRDRQPLKKAHWSPGDLVIW